MIFIKKYMLNIFCLLIIVSCNDSTTANNPADVIVDSNSNVAVSASSAASSAASNTEIAAMSYSYNESNYVFPTDAINGFSSACDYATARSSCSSSSDTLTWSGCTLQSGTVTLTGGWTSVYTGTNSASCGLPLVAGETVTRTSSDVTTTLASGATISTNTNSRITWDGTTIPSTGEVTSKSGGNRTVVINGINIIKKSPHGTIQYDHSITSNGLVFTGGRATHDRVVSGSVTLYHNRAKFNAINVFNAVTYGDSTCCYPTSGNITSTFTGSQSGTTTLTFTSTCGYANFTDLDNSVNNIKLEHCI